MSGSINDGFSLFRCSCFTTLCILCDTWLNTGIQFLIMNVDIWYVFVHTNILFFCLCVAGVHLCSLYLLYKQLNTRHICHSSIAVKVQVYIIT